MPLIHDYIINRTQMLYLILLILIQLSFGMRLQSVGAKGRLFCGGKPASDVQVKLMDKDTGVCINKFN